MLPLLAATLLKPKLMQMQSQGRTVNASAGESAPRGCCCCCRRECAAWMLLLLQVRMRERAVRMLRLQARARRVGAAAAG